MYVCVQLNLQIANSRKAISFIHWLKLHVTALVGTKNVHYLEVLANGGYTVVSSMIPFLFF